MANELIFMGRQEGKVRLALFDNSHGTARKLPVKEVTEDVFVAGIKNGSLPVRGFGVANGRITCKYGDWYKLPNVTYAGALALFGLVHLGIADVDEDGQLPNVPSGYASAQQVKFYGLASVDWETGMFRVISPGTYFYMLTCASLLLYTYNGPITKKKLQPKDTAEERFGVGVDYTFEECDSTETLGQIANWMRIDGKSVYVYLQWLYQRCELFATTPSRQAVVTSLLSSTYYALGTLEVVQLGKRPIDILEVPANLIYVSVLEGRKVSEVRVDTHTTVALRGFNDTVIHCPSLSRLTLSEGTRARLVRSADSPPMYVSGWEGFIGSNGDYRGYNIRHLFACFVKQPDVSTLIFDAADVKCSFKALSSIRVEFKNPLVQVTDSFIDFVGSLNSVGMCSVYESFVNCTLTTPLDLRSTEYLDSSVIAYKGDILLPDYFKRVAGDVFRDTAVTQVKMRPDSELHVYGVGSLTIDNDNLTVSVECLNTATQLSFYYGSFLGLFCTVPYGSSVPKFKNTSMLPAQPVLGATKLGNATFEEVGLTTLDFNLFPDVSVIPENTAVKCKFNTIIIGPNVTTLASKAFVDCDCLRWIYIPNTVTDLGMFIYHAHIAYTICTQKGSAADKFAKKNSIEVKYTDNEREFKLLLEEVPEVLEGALLVASLSGKSDGEEVAVSLACTSVEMASDIGEKFIIQEKANVHALDVDIIRYKYADTLRNYCLFKPCLHLVMAHVSNSAEYNPNVLNVMLNHIDVVSQLWYRSSNYTMVCSVLNTTSKEDFILWLVLKDTTVINAFTECVSSIKSACSLRAELNQALATDYNGEAPTNLSSLLEHLNFTKQFSVSLRGKVLEDTVCAQVRRALCKTYVPLGFYKSTTGARALIAQDVSNLKLVAFGLSAGVGLDAGRRTKSDCSMWSAAAYAIGGAHFIDSLDKWTRIYSVIGAGDAMVLALSGKSLVKCVDYDESVPTVEIEAFRVLRNALSGYNSVTTEQLKTALKTCGLARPVAAGVWEPTLKKVRDKYISKFYCVDGSFQIVADATTHVSWWVISGYSVDADCVYTLAIADALEYVIKSIVDLYDSLDPRASFREDHYALVNAMLPSAEFLGVREFQSGGSWSTYSSAPYLAVSRITGKIVVASRVLDKVVPIFWANSFKEAIRIFELLGMTPFSHRQEWLRTKCSSITSDIFRDKDAYAAGVPDFAKYDRRLKATREAIRRGECNGYACPTGVRDIFDLAMKNPRVSDYKGDV